MSFPACVFLDGSAPRMQPAPHTCTQGSSMLNWWVLGWDFISHSTLPNNDANFGHNHKKIYLLPLNGIHAIKTLCQQRTLTHKIFLLPTWWELIDVKEFPLHIETFHSWDNRLSQYNFFLNLIHSNMQFFWLYPEFTSHFWVALTHCYTKQIIITQEKRKTMNHE